MLKKHIRNILKRIRQPIIDELSDKILQNREILQSLAATTDGLGKQIAATTDGLGKQMAANAGELAQQMTANTEGLSQQMAAGTTQTHQVVFDHINSLAQRIDTLDMKLHLAQADLSAMQRDIIRFHTAWQHSMMEADGDKRLNRLKDIYQLFPMYEVKDIPMTRLGRSGDGGYTMVDDFAGIQIAYSFGISDDTSWDSDALANGLSDVYMYDHTIEGLPDDQPGFHWFKTGIAGVYDPQVPELRTLEQLLKDNGHENQQNMLLKMDVEGAEWDVFNHVASDTLGRFSQIVLEMHHVTSQEKHDEILQALKILNKTHVVVNLHGNNWEGYEYGEHFSLPDALEVTYVNKEKYAHNLQRCIKFFPADIDEQNTEKLSEIIMGSWGK